MIDINPKWQKAENVLATIVVWGLIVFFALIFIGFILEVLFNKGVLDTDYHKQFYDIIEPVIISLLTIFLALVVPSIIIRCKVPAREDIVDDQLLTLLQRTENIEKRLTKNEQEVAEMEDQMRNAIKCPLHGLDDFHRTMLQEKLLVVASPKKLETNQINRANTAQFLRALQLMGYIDASESGNTLRLWVEQVTNLRDPDKYHFTEAYTQAGKQDKKVQRMMVEIEEFLKD